MGGIYRRIRKECYKHTSREPVKAVFDGPGERLNLTEKLALFELRVLLLGLARDDQLGHTDRDEQQNEQNWVEWKEIL